MSEAVMVNSKRIGAGTREGERQDRRAQLVDATLTAISEHGLSHTTLAKVAKIADLSPGIVNFYFKSKDVLLLSTLRHLIDEFESVIRTAADSAGDDPVAALEAIVDACFQPVLSDPRKHAVWYAFWGESGARQDYLELCGDKDEAYVRRIRSLFQQLIDKRGHRHLDADALARGLVGMVEGLWQESLVAAKVFELEGARSICRAYLRGAFPEDFDDSAVPGDDRLRAPAYMDHSARDAALTLPAWVYDNEEFHALEREKIFMPSWQVVCHVSDVARPGQYVTFELMGERAFVVRGEDDEIRAFHNVCRHRAHSVVQGKEGHCERFLQCPYHGWTYDFDGRLRAIPDEKTFPCVDKSRVALPSIDLEVFRGFVFIRFDGSGPSVAERFGAYGEELAHYRCEDMQPCDDAFWTADIAVDWKNLMDNYLEDYHFRIGHPGLFGLMNREYDREVSPQGVSRLSHSFRDEPAGGWSERLYHALLPEQKHLPEDLRRRWSYFTLFPAVNFDVFPEKMDFFQMLPLGPGKTRLRGRCYALPDDRRAMRAVRYLSHRANRRVQYEDVALVEEVQKGLASGSYTLGVLSEKEIVVHGFQEWIRKAIPVAGLASPPSPGIMASR